VKDSGGQDHYYRTTSDKFLSGQDIHVNAWAIGIKLLVSVFKLMIVQRRLQFLVLCFYLLISIKSHSFV